MSLDLLVRQPDRLCDKGRSLRSQASRIFAKAYSSIHRYWSVVNQDSSWT